MKYLTVLVLCLLSWGCKGKGPKLTLCISDPAQGAFQCVNPNGSNFVLPYAESENYVALSPQDTETLFNWCRKERAK